MPKVEFHCAHCNLPAQVKIVQWGEPDYEEDEVLYVCCHGETERVGYALLLLANEETSYSVFVEGAPNLEKLSDLAKRVIETEGMSIEEYLRYAQSRV